MVPRLRDKVVRTLTLRQTWPRNMSANLARPSWMGLPARAPFPPNVLYDRPRSIDRTPPDGGGVAAQEGLITVEPALSHGGVSDAAALAAYGASVFPPLDLLASAPVAGVVTFTWTEGEGPFILDPGDGSAVIDPAVSGVTHDYTAAGAGTYEAVLTDSTLAARVGTVSVEIAAAVFADPWDNMSTHSAIDNYVAEASIETPTGWSAMTIAQKKEWLDNNA